MAIPLLDQGTCRAWEADGLGGWTCQAVAPPVPDQWTLEPEALASAFGAGLVVMAPLIVSLVAGYSIMRVLRNRRS